MQEFTRDELLLGVALLKAIVHEDGDALTALSGEGEDGAAQALRGLAALARAVLDEVIVPRMWVVRLAVKFDSAQDVPELKLAAFLVDRIEARVSQAHHMPLVVSLSADDVLGLIVQLAGTGREQVPEFLDGMRNRTLASMVR